MNEIIIFSLPSSAVHLSKANEYQTFLPSDSISCKTIEDLCVKSFSITAATWNKTIGHFNS